MRASSLVRSVADLTKTCANECANAHNQDTRLRRLARRRMEAQAAVAEEIGVSVWDLYALFK